MRNHLVQTIILVVAELLLTGAAPSGRSVFLEAEGFDDCGGWTNDNQSMMQMGSPYLIAHGLSRPVQDATTGFKAPKEGTYRLWVRTRDWTKPWGRTESPGRFQVLVNGKPVKVEFGTETEEWSWQDGGTVELLKGDNTVALHDLTGFDGRCDALYLTMDLDAPAPDATPAFRRKHLGLKRPSKAGEYDFVVVGGGIAGICAAITAARLGSKVALVQNRPVLGGNNSSEIRVGLSGLIYQDPYPELGRLMDEIGGIGYWTNYEAQRDPDSPRSRNILKVLEEHPEKHIHNAGPASNYEDGKKLDAVLSEPNITLFLNKQVISAKTRRGRICSVVAKDISTSEEIKLKGRLFADCTGDANLGFLAGADWRMGRESKAETGESQAPDEPDMLTMGTSVQWYASEGTESVDFPECPWAMAFSDSTCIPIVHGEWDWEAGLGRDQVYEIEYIRDLGLRAVYGNWAYLKNNSPYREQFQNQRLEWVACIGGKRESRRLLGDVILKEQDITEGVEYDDATFTATWGMDLHYPKNEPGMEGEEPFRATSVTKRHKPFAVPYRCLYSRNIGNLMMAGRDISVTHAALGTIRVMRTGGMMGEVVGMAASVCKKHRCDPRKVYASYLEELKSLMEEGVPSAVPAPQGRINPENKKEWKLVWKDEFNYKNRDQLLKVWESANGPTTHTLCSRWPENVEVGGGTVRLVNHKESRGGQDWTSGSLTSYEDFMYGYFECRYKYAAATGTNNSFWIMARDTGIMPEEGKPFEIDINEGHYPSEYTNCVHEWISTKYTSSNGGSEKYPGIDFSKDFHTFGLEWTRDEIVFYIDRKEFRRIRNEFCFSPAPLRLSEAILAWGGQVTDAIDGTAMEVDYVRVYSRR